MISKKTKFERYTKLDFEGGSSYIVDKYIIYAWVSIALLFVIIIFFKYGFQIEKQYYINCDVPQNIYFNSLAIGKCQNILYLNFPICEEINNGAFCNVEYFDNGFTYGEPTPWIINYFPTIIVFLLIIALIINDLINNNRFK